MRGGGTSRVGLRSAVASWEWPIPTRSDDSPRMPAPTGKAGDSVAFAPTGPTRRHRGLQDAESFGSRYRGPTSSSRSHRVGDNRPLRGSGTDARSRKWVRRTIKSQGQCRPSSPVWRCSGCHAENSVESACRSRIRSPSELRHIALQPMARWDPEAARAAGTRAFTSSMSRSTESPCFWRR